MIGQQVIAEQCFVMAISMNTIHTTYEVSTLEEVEGAQTLPKSGTAIAVPAAVVPVATAL